VTPCGDVVRHRQIERHAALRGEDGGSVVFRNVNILPRQYTAS